MTKTFIKLKLLKLSLLGLVTGGVTMGIIGSLIAREACNKMKVKNTADKEV